MNKLFPMNLQFFAQDTGSEGGTDSSADNDAGVDGASDGKENTETKADNTNANEHMIPKSRFDEINNAYKEMKTQIEELEVARITKETKDAEAKGEFENLYKSAQTELESKASEYATTSQRVEALEGVIGELLETKLNTIDKEYHDLIPAGMQPEQKLAWVNMAEAKGIFGTQKVNEPLGERTNPNGNESSIDTKDLSPLQKMLSGYNK